VPLDRSLVRSYRLSLATKSVSAAVWLQFEIQGLSQPLKQFLAYLLVVTDKCSGMHGNRRSMTVFTNTVCFP